MLGRSDWKLQEPIPHRPVALSLRKQFHEAAEPQVWLLSPFCSQGAVALPLRASLRRVLGVQEPNGGIFSGICIQRCHPCSQMSTVDALEITTVTSLRPHSLLGPAVKNLAGYTGVLVYVSDLATPMTTLRACCKYTMLGPLCRLLG